MSTERDLENSIRKAIFNLRTLAQSLKPEEYGLFCKVKEEIPEILVNYKGISRTTIIKYNKLVQASKIKEEDKNRIYIVEKE